MDNLASANKNVLSNCKLHENYILELLYFSNQDQSCEEVCFKCIQMNQDKYDYSNIVHVNDILFSSEETIITNFPPLLNEKIHLQLSKCIILQIDQQIDEIRMYFENLKENIISAIKKIQTQVDSKIQLFQQKRQELIETYNIISSKQQIKQIYQEQKENLSEKINEVFQEKFKNIEENTNILKEKIKSYLSNFDNISFEKPIQLQNDILLLLNNIDFFSKFNNQVQQQQDSQQEESGQKIYSEKTNCEILMDLISNKTNYCTQESINQIQQIFHKYSNLLNQTHLNSKVWKICDYYKKESFKNINSNQLESLRVISIKMQELDKKYNSSYNQNTLSDNIQPFSNIICKQYKKFRENKDLQNLLRQYPIFELENSSKYFQVYKINLIKSLYDYSNYQRIEQTNNGIEITKVQNSEGFAIAYTDFVLDINKKYIIRVEINYNSNYSSFGLIQNSNKDHIFLHESQLNYNERSNYNDFNKIVKGNQPLQRLQQNINKQLELRVHLQQQFMRVGSYPDYQFVNELDDKNRIEPRQSYRLATQLGYLNDKITIFDFYSVDEFDSEI